MCNAKMRSDICRLCGKPLEGVRTYGKPLHYGCLRTYAKPLEAAYNERRKAKRQQMARPFGYDDRLKKKMQTIITRTIDEMMQDWAWGKLEEQEQYAGRVIARRSISS